MRGRRRAVLHHDVLVDHAQLRLAGDQVRRALGGAQWLGCVIVGAVAAIDAQRLPSLVGRSNVYRRLHAYGEHGLVHVCSPVVVLRRGGIGLLRGWPGLRWVVDLLILSPI